MAVRPGAPERRARLTRWAVVAGAYYVTGWLSLHLALVGAVVTPIWPPSGIALVALLTYGGAVWPAITLAALALNLPIAGSPEAAMAIAVGNTLAPFLTWKLLRRVGFRQSLERLRDSLVLVLAGLAGMAVSALIGSAALIESGVIRPGEFLETFAVWWAGDASGILVFAPVMLVIGKPLPDFGTRVHRRLEAIALVAGLAVVSPLAFATSVLSSRYLVFPFLVWAAVRFGQVGAVVTTLLVTAAGIWSAAAGSGPFSEGSLLAKMLSLQAFNVSAATTAFILASATEERRRAMRLVERSADELEIAVRERSAELVAANVRLSEEVAERDRTQRLLGESEELFRTLFDSAPIGLAQAAPDGSLRRTNSAFRALVGFSDMELQSRAIFELVHEDDMPACRSMVEALVAGASAATEMELRFVRKEGSEFWGQMSVSLVRYQNGEPRFVHATLQDLTERRRSEALSRADAERQLLYDMFVGAPAAVFVTKGPDHLVEFANPHFVTLLADPDYVGKPVGEIFPEESGLSTPHILNRIYARGEPISITEVQLKLQSDGVPESTERFFNCTFQPMRRADGEIEGVTGHMIDVTELVRARSELEAVAAERANIYRHEHEIAETLQRSLLPDRLPELRGLSLAARYLPGSAGIDVGGDWYDVFAMPTGRVALVVGDVIGRGLKAAAAMGQLRIALRAYALDADDPAEVLARLSGLLEDLRDVEMATVFFGIVDYGHRSFRFASAGHPAPLLMRPDGEVEFLEGGRRPPLGVQMKGEPSAAADLEPGSTLLLYSDGLLESREQPIDDGMERLRKLVAHSDLDLEALCDLIIDNLGGSSADDIALLALRTSTTLEESLMLTVPSEPKALTAARRALQQWFRRVGTSEQETEDLVLATNEAIANSIYHAYGTRTGSVLVESEVVDDRIVITVTDQGLWEQSRTREGGRGFQLMRSLVDRLEVERSASGTVVRMTRRLGALPEERGEDVWFTRTAKAGPVKGGLIPVATIREDLDLHNASRIEQELDRLISGEAPGLIVDLSGIRFIDSAGLRVLFRVAEDLSQKAERMSVVAPEGSAVHDVLRLVWFESVAAVVDDLNAARAALGEDPAPPG